MLRSTFFLIAVLVQLPADSSGLVFPMNPENNKPGTEEPKPQQPAQPEKPPAIEIAPPPRPVGVRSIYLKAGTGPGVDGLQVARGLAWLRRQQKEDGRWEFDGLDRKEYAGATGLALLAFVGAGETHIGETRYQGIVKAGMSWLLKDLPLDGPNVGKFKSSATAYGQAIATLSLCETYGITRDKSLLAPAQAAIDYVQRSQKADGSWPETGTDTEVSLVAWQTQALAAAKLCQDIKVDQVAVQNIIRFLDSTAGGSRKSKYGQKDSTTSAPGTGLIACGLLCRYLLDGWGPNTPAMAEGVAGLMKRSPNPKAPKHPALDIYFYFHATRVVHFFDGDDWNTWWEGPEEPREENAINSPRKGGLPEW